MSTQEKEHKPLIWFDQSGSISHQDMATILQGGLLEALSTAADKAKKKVKK